MTERWPALPYAEWKDTYATLHMWMQIAGKLAVTLAPPLNHAWGIAFHMTPRGIASPVLPHPSQPFSVEFDFIDHRMFVRAANGDVRSLALEPQSVAAFHAAFMALLADMGLTTKIWTLPTEVPSPIRFEEDTVHKSYDPAQAHRMWRVFVEVWRVLSQTRANFIGKASPAHFFWGSFDLAVTRFSGREAPPREGPAFMREAYSHEVISHGFWPGNDEMPEPIFYAYAVPEPEGFKTAPVEPEAARYFPPMGEFILPYEAVRTSADPDAAIRAFVASTYEAGATLGNWDRTALERRDRL
jgi:hypothetical protein